MCLWDHKVYAATRLGISECEKAEMTGGHILPILYTPRYVPILIYCPLQSRQVSLLMMKSGRCRHTANLEPGSFPIKLSMKATSFNCLVFGQSLNAKKHKEVMVIRLTCWLNSIEYLIKSVVVFLCSSIHIKSLML